ncbi:MAG: 50S ribosomal protein L32 [Candidatus Andersenbacteria bacterium]|nr:50S ribosomal protein L32 [Candidatus Andersenbacteria bacterium]
MAVPKKRTGRSKRNKRRSHLGRRRVALHACPRCGQPVPGHTACPNCGTYRGREVIDVLRKLDKKERKVKEKELTQQEQTRAV